MDHHPLLLTVPLFSRSDEYLEAAGIPYKLEEHEGINDFIQ